MLQVYQASSGIRLPEEREREYLERLPLSMRGAIQRYRRWEDRQASLIGKLLLLHALLGRNPEWDFSILERLENSSRGKPFIKGVADFNISHSGEIVTLALVDDGRTGIDVEKIRPLQMDDFSSYLPEISDPDVFDETDRLNIFYDCWTKKEAVLKGEGSGLLAPLVKVNLRGDKAFYDGHVWFLRKIDCGADYCCHVATSELQSDFFIEILYF